MTSEWENAKSTVKKEIHVPEPILEPPRHILQVLHPAGTGGLAALGLLAPLVRPELGGGEAALGAGCIGYAMINIRLGNWKGRRTLVLLVESTVAAAPAEGVALGVALTVRRGL